MMQHAANIANSQIAARAIIICLKTFDRETLKLALCAGAIVTGSRAHVPTVRAVRTCNRAALPPVQLFAKNAYLDRMLDRAAAEMPRLWPRESLVIVQIDIENREPVTLFFDPTLYRPDDLDQRTWQFACASCYALDDDTYLLMCGRCQQVRYCSTACQHDGYASHKLLCTRV